MKPLIPTLVLSAAMPALCQTPHRPDQLPQVPPLQPSPHTWTQPRVFPFDRSQTLPGFTIRQPAPQFSNPQLDHRMIRRPPQDAFVQPKARAPLGSNLYPDLKLLPLETARLEPIPVYFPRFQMEPIPIASPEVKMVPIQAAAPQPAQKK